MSGNNLNNLEGQFIPQYMEGQYGAATNWSDGMGRYLQTPIPVPQHQPQIQYEQPRAPVVNYHEQWNQPRYTSMYAFNAPIMPETQTQNFAGWPQAASEVAPRNTQTDSCLTCHRRFPNYLQNQAAQTDTKFFINRGTQAQTEKKLVSTETQTMLESIEGRLISVRRKRAYEEEDGKMEDENQPAATPQQHIQMANPPQAPVPQQHIGIANAPPPQQHIGMANAPPPQQPNLFQSEIEKCQSIIDRYLGPGEEAPCVCAVVTSHYGKCKTCNNIGVITDLQAPRSQIELEKWETAVHEEGMTSPYVKRALGIKATHKLLPATVKRIERFLEAFMINKEIWQIDDGVLCWLRYQLQKRYKISYYCASRMIDRCMPTMKYPYHTTHKSLSIDILSTILHEKYKHASKHHLYVLIESLAKPIIALGWH